MTQLIAGLTESGTLFLVAAGLTLVFGAARLINVAHGSFYMYGAFVVASLADSATLGPATFWWAIIIGMIGMAVIGVMIEITVIRRLYGKDHLTQMVATLAILYILADIALRIWGTNARSVPFPPGLQGHIRISGQATPTYDLFVIGVAVVVGLALWGVLERTKTGWRVRAAVEDPETLSVTGTNVRRLSTGVFAAAAALAGLAGGTVAPLTSVAPGLDVSILVGAFIVAVIGGLGSVGGAAVGALIIGLFQVVSTLWIPSLSSSGIYIAMVIVLALRPTGLFGVRNQVTS